MGREQAENAGERAMCYRLADSGGGQYTHLHTHHFGKIATEQTC